MTHEGVIIRLCRALVFIGKLEKIGRCTLVKIDATRKAGTLQHLCIAAGISHVRLILTGHYLTLVD